MEEVNFKLEEGLSEDENERNPGNWEQYYDIRQFKKEWHDMYPWIDEDGNDPRAAICRVCNTRVQALESVLESHQKTNEHLIKLSGYDEEVQIENYPQRMHPPGLEKERLEPVIVDNQVAYFTESLLGTAHNAVTNRIDGLVEKYHNNRLENLQIENDVKMQVQAQKAALTEARNQHLSNMNIQSRLLKQQELDFKLKLAQHQQVITLNSMEKEWDSKLTALEQQLLFSRHLYERKVKLLDQQLQFIK